MIDPTHPLGSWFLLLTPTFFLVFYALPLMLIPLTWARWFAWTVPKEQTDLTVYFGRCLGGVAFAVILVSYQAAPAPASNPMVFDLIGWVCVVMTLVHIWGAIRRIQPWTETVEIVFYAVVAGLAIWIRSTLG